MRTNNNKHVITNEIVWIRKLLFSDITSLSAREFSVVFNVLSSQANTNLSIKWFLHEQFLISKSSSILHDLLH